MFIGGRKAVETPSNRLKWDALGASIFEIDPNTRIGSVRIVCLMNSLGLPASYPTDSSMPALKSFPGTCRVIRQKVPSCLRRG